MLLNETNIITDEQPENKTYEAPELIEYGTVEDLTHLGGAV